MSDERAERAILDRAEAYRLVEEARQMREERNRLADERAQIAAILELGEGEAVVSVIQMTAMIHRMYRPIHDLALVTAERDALRTRLAAVEAEAVEIASAARIAAGALMLIHSADSLREKDDIAAAALQAFMQRSGWEPGSLTPEEARRALLPDAAREGEG